MSPALSCFENPVEAIGATPLVRLPNVVRETPALVYAKLEFMNPMGSIKDRIARYMIEKAEREGRIKKGAVIVENSSGNTALGLALVALQKGYRLKVVVRDSLSIEKMRQLQALGVEIVTVDSTLPPESPDSYNRITPRIAAETPDSFFPDQHNNLDNNETHYLSTGPEIWEQMEGRIDYFVAGIGTGGTVSGVARYLKERDPGIRVIAVDPEGSVFYDYFHHGKPGKSAPYLVEGLGDEFLIGCADFSNVDDVYRVRDSQAFAQARLLARQEGILVGGSSGAAVWAVRKLAATLQAPARIVTILPDGGSRYLSTIYNDEWLKAKGVFLDPGANLFL